MMAVVKFLSRYNPVRQPCAKVKKLNATQYGWYYPKLNHISLGYLENMKKNLSHSHHDHNLLKAKVLTEKSPAPSKKTGTILGLTVEIWI